METTEVLNSIDWPSFEQRVVEAVEETVERYNLVYSPLPLKPEKIFQISICTDPQVLMTFVAFETKQHALELSQVAPWNANPADFKFSELHAVVHLELRPLKALDFSDYDQRRATDERISQALLQSVGRIQERKILDPLPREDTVWLGVSSADDWYDHIRAI